MAAGFGIFALCTIIGSLSATVGLEASDDQLKVVKGDNGMFLLHKMNFYRAAQEYENMVVFFDGPDCEECNKHREELVRLATQYENKVAVGVLDTKKDADVARVFGIDVAPAVRFFRKGKPFKYEGKLFFEELFAWVEKMTAPAYKQAETEMEIYAVAENIGVSYLMFYNSSRAEESYFQHEFADLAATWQFVHDVKFYQVNKPDLIEYFRDVDSWIKATPRLLIFTKWTTDAPAEKEEIDFRSYYDPLHDTLKKKIAAADRPVGHEQQYRKAKAEL